MLTDVNKHTGLTMVARIYQKGNATPLDTVSCTETAAAIYTGDLDVSGYADGEYLVRLGTDVPLKYYGVGTLLVKDGVEITPEEYALASNLALVETKVQADSRQTLLAKEATLATKSSQVSVNALETKSEADARQALIAKEATVNTRASQASVDLIETKAQADSRQSVLAKESTLNTKASQASVSAIPTNTLLTTDSRLNNLDATISSVLTSIGNLNDLSVAQVTSIVPTTSEIEAALMNEGDGQALIDAIVTKINNDLDVSGTELAAIASAVRTELTVELARIDQPISSEKNANVTKVNGNVVASVSDFVADTTPVITAINNQTTAIKGADDKDLSQLSTEVGSIDVDFGTMPTDITSINNKVQTLNNYDDSSLQGKVDSVLEDTNELQTNQLDISTIINPITTAIANQTSSLQGVDNKNLSEIFAKIPTVIEIEGALLNDGDGSALMAALVNNINSNLDIPDLEVVVIANAVKGALQGDIDQLDALLRLVKRDTAKI